ncbi:DML1 [Candida theae]|uniref:Protein DML1 n=1 Tax=Candida theae TaxID=1198502 RepID=A0AAD5BJP3_9ASCO|nr:DML1 [Candida theae]KAI5968903.1 DML1 [Candida theae]
MSEIINISYGQFSNCTTTHLYNFQESQVPYTKDAKLNHQLSTFLYRSATSTNGSSTANYYPRALLFDLRGGLGAFNKYEYAEEVPHLNMPVVNQQPQVGTQLQKNDYQKSLDQGKTDGSLLNTGNTKYWTDFNKLIYNPRSILTLPSYQHKYNDFGSNYNLPAQKFHTFSTGQHEFKSVESESLENFRYWLEKCDNLQGLQVGTTIDDSWSGFTTSMIELVQDEFFNNKENVWIYGQFNHALHRKGDKLSIIDKVSQIKSFVELYKSSSLFIPLSPDYNSSVINGLDTNSIWHTSSIPALFINSIWGINNQYLNQVNMLHMQENLLRGDEAKKIVNEVKLVGEGDATAGMNGLMMDIDLTKVRDLSTLTQHIPPQEMNLGVSKSCANARYINRNYIMNDKKESEAMGLSSSNDEDTPTNIYTNPYMSQFAKIDTFPNILTNKSSKFHIEFNIHNGIKEYLKTRKIIIQNLRLNLDDVIGDKAELVEDISNIISSYSSGFESDDDDYYD